MNRGIIRDTLPARAREQAAAAVRHILVTNFGVAEKRMVPPFPHITLAWMEKRYKYLTFFFPARPNVSTGRACQKEPHLSSHS